MVKHVTKLTTFSASIILAFVKAKVMLGFTKYFVIFMSTNTVIMVMIMPNAKPAMRSFLRLKRKEKIIIEM